MATPPPTRRFADGDPVPGLDYWRGLAGRARALRVAPEEPLEATRTPGGTLLRAPATVRDAGRTRVDARLLNGGSGPTYDWEEVQFDRASGSWLTVDGGRSGTADLYEWDQDDTVPVGSVVEAWYYPEVTPPDWRFEFLRRRESCDGPITVTFTAHIGCCPVTGASIVFYRHDTAHGAEDVLAGCTVDAFGECMVTMPEEVLPGDIVDWVASLGDCPDQSDEILLHCGAQSVDVTFFDFDLLPGTITLTDPLGTVVVLTRIGAVGTADGRLWRGTHEYTLTNAYGCDPVTITVRYTWGAIDTTNPFTGQVTGSVPCGLELYTESPYFPGGGAHLVMLPGELYNCLESLGGAPPPGSVAYTEPDPGPEMSCCPLLMEYTPYQNFVEYDDPDAGNEFFFGQLCGCSQGWWNTFTTAGSGPGGLCDFRLFPCNTAFTVTL